MVPTCTDATKVEGAGKDGIPGGTPTHSCPAVRCFKSSWWTVFLCCGLGHVGLCTSQLRVESLFSTVLCFSWVWMWFQSQMSWGLISPVQEQRVRMPVWGTKLLLLKEKIHSHTYYFLCFSEGHYSKGGAFSEIVSLPPLEISAKPFYPLSWRYSASSQVLIRGNCSFSNCIFIVSVGEGEFRVFLCHHLELPPHAIFLYIM